MARAQSNAVTVDAEQLEEAEAVRRLVLAIKPIDPEKMLFKGHRTDILPRLRGEADRPAPTFTVSETAKIFFGRTSWWLRWCERMGKTSKGGKLVKVELNGKRVTKFVGGKKVVEGRTGSNHSRNYTLGDIERLAHILAQNGAIDGVSLGIALMVARNIAIVWRMPFNES